MSTSSPCDITFIISQFVVNELYLYKIVNMYIVPYKIGTFRNSEKLKQLFIKLALHGGDIVSTPPGGRGVV